MMGIGGDASLECVPLTASRHWWVDGRTINSDLPRPSSSHLRAWTCTRWSPTDKLPRLSHRSRHAALFFWLLLYWTGNDYVGLTQGKWPPRAMGRVARHSL